MSIDLPSVPFPDLIPDRSTLYVTSVGSDAVDTLRDELKRTAVAMSEPFPNVLAAQMDARSLQDAAVALGDRLSATDQQYVRCHLAVGMNEPTLAQLMQAYSLQNLIAWVSGLWLNDVLGSRRLVTYFQPIVPAAEPHQVFAYECLLRGREQDGKLISPARLFAAARDTGLLSSLDDAARLTAIATFRETELHHDTRVFINVNPRAVEDPARTMESTLRATLASGLAPERVIFEVVESDEITDISGLVGILDCCREVGCRVALDDLGAGYNSLTLLARIRPDFIKLDMDLIRNVDQDPYKSRVAAKLLELARELDVKTVAEGIETEAEWQWTTRHGADFVQGYYFARPAPIPPQPRHTMTAGPVAARREQGPTTA